MRGAVLITALVQPLGRPPITYTDEHLKTFSATLQQSIDALFAGGKKNVSGMGARSWVPGSGRGGRHLAPVRRHSVQSASYS